MSVLITVTVAVPRKLLGPQNKLTSSEQQLVHDFKRKMHASAVWVEVREEDEVGT